MVLRGVVAVTAVTIGLGLGACGEPDPAPRESEPRGGADLTVTFSYPRERTVEYKCSVEASASAARCGEDELERLHDLLLEPRDGTRACTLIYGGPQVAEVSGTLQGKRVSARFTRQDGCAMADYDALAAVLAKLDRS